LNGWGRYVRGNILACTTNNLLQPNKVITISLEWNVSIDRAYN
jgi:hypothetical protein